MDKRGSTNLRRSIIGKILPLFTLCPGGINASLICNVYSQVGLGCLSIKQSGFKNRQDFYEEVNIFDKLEEGRVNISRIKLLIYVLEPLLGIPPDKLDSSFVKLNSFSPQILCNFCKAPSLEFLMSELQRGQNPVPVLINIRPPLLSAQPLSPAQLRPVHPQLHPQVQHPPPSPIQVPAPSRIVPHPSRSVEPRKTVQGFPNNDIPPQDEVYLPPLPGNPYLEMPDPTQITDLPPRPVILRGEDRSKIIQKIDNYLKAFITVLSSQGMHLPVDTVTNELNFIIGNHFRFVSRREIKVWNDFDKLYKRLDAFIQMFCWQCPFTSLYELQRTILKFENVTDFNDLHLGPILKHPLVQKFFKVPDSLSNVPEVTTYDILTTLNDFINKHKKGDNIWDMLEEFMDFFANKFEADSPQHLCVRVSSFRMAISTNLKYRTSQRMIRETREAEIASKLNEVLDFEVNNLKRSLRRMSENERDLIKKSPPFLIESVFMLSKDLFPSRLQSRLYTFFDTVLKDPNLRKLFTVAMYQGVYGIQEYVKEQERRASANVPDPFQRQEEFVHISKREVAKAIEDRLKSTPFPIDLAILAEVEQSLVKHWNVNHFDSFHHGSFLSFIEQDEQLVKCIGGRHIGGNGRSISSYQRNRILGFISLIKDSLNKECVSSAIKDQFHVKHVEDLACGGIDKLLTDASQSTPVLTSSSIPLLTYTVPLVINEQPKKQSNPSCSGLLGPQSSEDANHRLSQAPLLADLSEWMQWDLVYAPSLGSLAEYLINQQAESSNTIHTLCDLAGRFLKIDPNSTRGDFETAVQLFDPVYTAGHLVSIAVTQTSVHLMSLQLLAKCVLTKLEQVEGALKDSSLSELFVFNCLQRIPLELCETLGKQVFLDPLKKVKNIESVNSLIKLCGTPSQRCFFQALGMKLGVSEWINNFKQIKTSEDLGDHFMSGSIELSGETVKSIKEGYPQRVIEEAVPTTIESVIPTATPSDTDTVKPAIADKTLEVIKGLGEDETRAIIDLIREEEFGVGLHEELTEKQLKISNKQTEREGRSLQRLSQELYSKDTHFVLELIQNADDNSYSLDLSVHPTVQFVLHKDCICVLNNEVGFLEKNIRAICDVGKSTKDPSRSGYIGQKGIGFKSVFRITDAPEVHSNNFHIRFNTASGPIGYILPEWVERSFIDDKMPSSELARWTTRIVLPMKQDGNTQNMVKKFKDIQPSLLLFLNRLRSIIIKDIESNIERRMVRHDQADGVTEITHDHGKDFWLVTRKELNDASRYKPGIQTTELAIAFPLPKDFSTLPNARDLQSQQVFAYLPLRSYGFRFIIQGDFDLPSSREDVNEDSTWNQWLREMIPSLFMEALDNIKVLPQLTILQAIFLFIQFIPLDGEVHDFFKPVTSQILRLLKSSEWLPTDPISANAITDNAFDQIIDSSTSMTDITDDPEITWKQPSRLLMIPHELIRDSIPQSVVASSLNLFYLHSSLVSPPLKISSDVCSYLGIGTMTVDHLVDIAKCVLDSYHSNSQSNSSSSFLNDDSDDESYASPFESLVGWVARWLACVHTVLEESRNINTLSNIKKLPIIPLMDDSLVALDSVVVFFPPASSDPDHDKYKKIYKQLKTVHYDLLDSEGQVIRGKVYEILSDRLGVKELSPVDVINHHIIPGFTPSMKNDVNISYLKFIKDHVDRCIFTDRQTSEIMEKLRNCVCFLTDKGMKDPREEIIHFSSEYKDRWDHKTLFPGVKWTVVSSKYLEKNADIASWRKFFIDLGIKSGLVIERIDHVINPATHKDQQGSVWNVQDWFRSPDGLYTVRDHYCREFDDIIQSASTSHDRFNQMRSLARLIDTCWESDFKAYFEASYFDGSNTIKMGDTISSFGASIKDKAWLPVMAVDEEPFSTPVMKGAKLYAHKDDIVLLLDCHVPYLAYQLQNHDLLQRIQVKTKLSSENLVEFLMQWSQSSCQQPEGFVTSIEHMRRVYHHLASKALESADIKKLFGKDCLIYIPTTFRPPHEVGNGEFVSIHDACWTDKTTILYNMLKRKDTPPSHLPQVLSYFYYSNDEMSMQSMKHSFEAFGIEKGMKLNNLIDMFEFNSHSKPTPDTENIKNFRSIVEVLIKALYERSEPDSHKSVLNEQNQSFFIKNIAGKKVFPTTNKKWADITGLMVDDNPKISEYFKESDTIHFLKWPKPSNTTENDPHQSSLRKFVEICKIPSVGNNYLKDVAPGSNVKPFNDLQKRFHHIIPLVQLYIISLMPQTSTQQYHEEVFQVLQRVQFFSTTELNCTYEIKGHRSPAVQLRESQLVREHPSSVIYGVVDNEGKLLVKSSLVQVLQELVNLENDDGGIKWFLNALITDEPCNDADKASMKNQYRLGGFPEDAEFPKWDVKLPQMYLTRQDKKPLEENDEEDEVSDSEYQDSLDTTNQDEDGGGLKAWPPRAAVPDKSTNRPLNKNQAPETLLPTTKDMVTSDYVMKMRLKAGQQVQPTEEGEEQELSKEDRVPVRHESHQPSSGHRRVSRTESTDNEHRNETKKINYAKNDVGHSMLPDTRNSHTQDHIAHDNAKDKKPEAAGGTHAADKTSNRQSTNILKSNGSLHKTTICNFDNIEAVEISHLMQSISFESTNMLLPDGDPALKERMLKSGQWGEVFVYTLLKKTPTLPGSHLKIVDVKWINEEAESGLPYDIEVSMDNDTSCYIEVKSTSSNDKELIPFSWRELKFAQEKGADYGLVRVYNALSMDHVQIKWLQNLYDVIENNQSVRLFLRF